MTRPDETPFADWTYEHARKALDEAIEQLQGGRDAFERNKRYVEEGDHWQGGDGWPGAGEVDPAVRNKVLKAVEPQFTPADAIGECLGRFVSAMLRVEPALSFAPLEPAGEGEEEGEPSEQQKDAAEEMLRDISRWWDRKKLMRELRAACRRSRWGARGSVRLWLNEEAFEAPREEGEAGETEAESERRLRAGLKFQEALELVEISAPQPDASVVYTHPRTRRRAALFFFTDGADRKKVEITYLDDQERTVFRVVGESNGDIELSDPLDLGGRLAVQEMEAPLLVTSSVRRQQRKLNFLETQGLRVGEAAGFPERYTLNAEPHGIWLSTPPAEGPALDKEIDDEGRIWYLHRAPRPLGPAITTDLKGLATRTADGGEVLHTPGVEFKEPTDPRYVNDNSEHTKRRLYEEMKQLHVLIAGDATASGKSREEARADFEDDLHGVRPDLEALIREVVEGAIALAGTMSEERREFLEDFRAVVTVHASSGPISPEERREHREAAKEGLLSKESAMAASGVEDVAAELAAIAAQPDYQLELRKRQAEVMQMVLMAAPELPLTAAARFAGLDDTEDAELLAILADQGGGPL